MTDTIQLTPAQAASIHKFLRRATLSGAEVPEYIEVLKALALPPDGKKLVTANSGAND